MELKVALRSGLPLLVLLITALDFRTVGAQLDTRAFGTPAYCLLSRLEVVPCNRRFPGRTKFPNENQYGEYSTRIRLSSAGTFTCLIRNRHHIVRDISIFPTDARIKFIFSPGRRLEDPKDYGNQVIVRYNVSCPAGHLAFFNISQIDMEEANCNNTNLNQLQCVDYVRVVHPDYGTTDSCGKSTSTENRDRLEAGKFEILFRTSDTRSFPGFEATVICFDQGIGNRPGCTRPTENGTVTVDMSVQSTSGRRRRDLEEFHNKWKRHLAHLKRRRRRQTTVPKIRFETINVPFGVDVFYMRKELTFRLRDGGMPPENLEPIKEIFIINTFDVNGNSSSFIGEAKADDGRELALQGPGPLTVVGNYAYFQLFVIDPRGIAPTPAEMVAIGNLTQAQYALVTEENSTRQNPEELNPDCTDPVKDLNLPPNQGVTLSPECPQRAKRQAVEITSDMLEDSAVITAILNENACNAILRTSAEATINFMEMMDNDRLRQLREEVESLTATTAPPMMDTTPPPMTDTTPNTET